MTLLGYDVEKVGEEPGRVGYLLRGPKVTYRLIRQTNRKHELYATNSRGNLCNIKGNYRFSDADGTLTVLS